MKPYNPLEKENLGKSVADSLIKQKLVPLGCVERFSGAGVYAIYYEGDFDAYSKLGHWNTSADDLNVPIYVGKAVPTGGRKGKVDPEISAKGTALFSRLDEHRKSIEQVTNLEIADFWCRYLVVDDIWIPLGESLLIQRHRPIWNSLIDGFGNHDPGAGRHQGARPNWDTLHPGRNWADRCAPSKSSEAQIRLHIEQYWKAYGEPAIEE
ncbi:MAG: Eco29kI family restriction endonuclease [Luteolibacter sp.]